MKNLNKILATLLITFFIFSFVNAEECKDQCTSDDDSSDRSIYVLMPGIGGDDTEKKTRPIFDDSDDDGDGVY